MRHHAVEHAATLAIGIVAAIDEIRRQRPVCERPQPYAIRVPIKDWPSLVVFEEADEVAYGDMARPISLGSRRYKQFIDPAWFKPAA